MSKCTCAFPCGGTTPTCPTAPAQTVTIGERAVQHIINFQSGHPWPADMADAATCLAKIGVMLTVYGSTAAALLNNIHERGFDAVTLEDVERVQRFIMENS